MTQGTLQETTVLPEKAKVSVSGSTVTIEGPKGKLVRDFTIHGIKIKMDGNGIQLSTLKNSKYERKALGSIRAHLINMAQGVIEGHHKKMKICSGHFPMNVSISGNEFIVKNFLGEKTPRKLKLPEGVKVEIKGADVNIEGCDKEIVGNTSGKIEKLTKRSNFDKRIFQDGIITILD